MAFSKTLCAVALLLSACQSTPSVVRVAPAPASAMQECPALKQVSSTLNLGQLTKFTIGTVQQYNECRARHKSLIDYNKR